MAKLERVMKNFVRWSLVVASVLASVAAQAQSPSYPSKLIKAIIPFGAGSATDVVPRLLFERLGPELGQQIVVENRAGAGGTLGSGAVAKADPDGYTLLAHSSALAIGPAIFPNLTYDVAKDLSSVLMIGSNANVMIVPLERKWKTVQDFMVDAKAKGSAINFGSVGVGSAVHISAEKFRRAAGFEATHVPYRGGGVGEELRDVGLDAAGEFFLPRGAVFAVDGAVGGPVVFPVEAEVDEGAVAGGLATAEEIGALQADEGREQFGRAEFLDGALGAGGGLGQRGGVEIPLVAVGDRFRRERGAVRFFEVGKIIELVGDDHLARGRGFALGDHVEVIAIGRRDEFREAWHGRDGGRRGHAGLAREIVATEAEEADDA
eukprot:gene37028-biopygen24403